MKPMKLPLSVVKMDPTLQLRTTCLDTIEAYAELMREGVDFDPITVVYDTKAYWLVDGFHRVHAAKEANVKLLVANVHTGTKRDAERMAMGVNENGLNRDKATKMEVVRRIENDSEWKLLSGEEKAKMASMSHRHYQRLQSEIADLESANLRHCRKSGTEDSAIPEPENEADSALKPTPSAKIEGKAHVADAVGNNVPDNLRDIFLRQQEIKDFIGWLDRLKSDTKEAIKANPTLWSYFRTNPFEVELANVRRQFRFAVPHAVCPYCSGIDADKCKACKGVGFVNEEMYRATPVELK